MNGFKMFGNLDGVKYMPPVPPENVSSDVRKPNDDILDIIFGLDPVTNMPNGAIGQYLSDKTNDQVRSFIERNLLNDILDCGTMLPMSLRDDVMKLDSDFIGKCMRRRDESKEDYESRMETMFSEMENDKKLQAKIKEIKAKYEKSKS